jgi:hypothetical protein
MAAFGKLQTAPVRWFAKYKKIHYGFRNMYNTENNFVYFISILFGRVQHLWSNYFQVRLVSHRSAAISEYIYRYEILRSFSNTALVASHILFPSQTTQRSSYALLRGILCTGTWRVHDICVSIIVGYVYGFTSMCSSPCNKCGTNGSIFIQEFGMNTTPLANNPPSYFITILIR